MPYHSLCNNALSIVDWPILARVVVTGGWIIPVIVGMQQQLRCNIRHQLLQSSSSYGHHQHQYEALAFRTSYRRRKSCFFGSRGIESQQHTPATRLISSSWASSLMSTAPSSSSVFTYSSYTKLPRLYVGPNPPLQPIHLDHLDQLQHMTVLSSQATMIVGPNPPPSTATTTRPMCYVGAILTLTPNQSHYLTTVLRYGKRKTRSDSSTIATTRDADKSIRYTSTVSSTRDLVTGDPTTLSYVRVFDGVSGEEWLASVLVPLMNPSGNGQPSKRRPRARANPIVEECLQVQCEIRLNPSSSHSYETTLILDNHNRAIDNSQIWLAVVPPKNKDRIRFLIEKTIELGVTGFFFVESDHGEVRMSDSNLDVVGIVKNMDKLQAYNIETSEQCERTTLAHFVTIGDPTARPESQQPATNDRRFMSKLCDLLDSFRSYHPKSTTSPSIKLLICRERSNTRSLWHALDDIVYPSIKHTRISTATKTDNDASCQAAPTVVILLVGPEGGWSGLEEIQMDQLQTDFQDIVRNVSLGPNVLRTETASIAAVATYMMHRSSQEFDELSRTLP